MMPKSYRPRIFFNPNYISPYYLSRDHGPARLLPSVIQQQMYYGSEMPHHHYQGPVPFPPSSMSRHTFPTYVDNSSMRLLTSRADFSQLQFPPRRYYSSESKETLRDDESAPKSGVQQDDPLSASLLSVSTQVQINIEAPILSQQEITRSFEEEISDLRHTLLSLRKWEYTQLGRLIGTPYERNSIGRGTRFTVMSYNVLAQNLLTEHMNLYKGCDPRALNQNFRKQLFFSELDEIRPDILCLQEVTEKDYYKLHEPILFLKGYQGIYKKRTGDKMDGCAIFYQTSKFRFIEELAVEFCQPHSRILNRDNVGLLIKLETNKCGTGRQETFVVGTTHILFNPKRVDVKFAQVQLFLSELDRFAFCGLDSQGNPLYHPTVLTGDFNSEPCSTLVRFLTCGVFRQNSKDSLPVHLGVSDQCQHYQIVLERLKHWQKHRNPAFQLDSKVESSLVNLRKNSVISNAEVIRGDDLDICNSELFPPLDQSPPYANTSENKLCRNSIKSDSFSDDVDLNSLLSDADRMRLEAYKSFSSHRLSPIQDTSSSVAPVQLRTELNVEEHNQTLEEINKFGKECTFESGQLFHNFKLNNVYAPQLDRRESSHDTATTRQIGWTTVDYIFYSKIWNKHYNKQTEGKLRLIRRLGLLTKHQCKELGPIPNLAVSSDHYSLVAEFVLQ